MPKLTIEPRKVVSESTALRRTFHADLFLVGDTPRVLAILFGGSGVSQAVYRERTQSVVPVFDAALERLAASTPFAFAFVTAPYDVAFSRFADEPEEAGRWNAHVEGELVPAIDAMIGLPRGTIPLYVMGYSGGAALALSGHHHGSACIGAGVLGADGLTADVRRGNAWAEPITIYYNLDDDVFGANREVLRELQSAGEAEVYRRLPGGHPLADYVGNESFGGLVRRALRLAS